MVEAFKEFASGWAGLGLALPQSEPHGSRYRDVPVPALGSAMAGW